MDRPTRTAFAAAAAAAALRAASIAGEAVVKHLTYPLRRSHERRVARFRPRDAAGVRQKYCRGRIAAVIALTLGLVHAEARHERDHAREESELTAAVERVIDRSPVVRYLHSVRIENLRVSEDGARVVPRLDRNGHQETTYPRVPLWDRIHRNGRIVATTDAPGKSVSVALALRDREELGEVFDLQDKVNRVINETYRTIFRSDFPVCIAVVALHAEFFEDRGGYTRLSVLGPVFGTAMTARSAKDVPWDGYDSYSRPQFWTPLFIRDQFHEEIERLLGFRPSWDRPREGYQCPRDD